ncbi:hypothetical protein MTR67_008937 [Solanum verrucosum]|uniref:FAD-binding PCMH-type domain-containing protein n=2 Tax=Solanum TaxID=4107 RepID=A0AAF0Q2D6_SOLVR|nr:hypothetical protein MTR67_008937 [Solanum verrucosum]
MDRGSVRESRLNQFSELAGEGLQWRTTDHQHGPWSDLRKLHPHYRIAEKSKKLAFPAGVFPTVGVGGHFSGGGYGMLAQKFGTATDNIIDAKLIDANGQIKDRESMGEDHFWAIRGGGGTSFGLIISWKVKLHDIRKKVTVFNVTRTLEQNATQLIYKWQHIADKVDDNLLLRLFLKSNVQSPFKPGQRSIQAIFSTMFVGGVDELLHEMQKSFPELGLMKEDCIEMSWIESIILFYGGFPNGTSPDALLNWNTRSNLHIYFKGKSDYVQHPISIKGLEGIWKLYNQLGENTGVELQVSPYGGKLSDISESETPFPHRAGNIFMIEYAVYWIKMEDSKRSIDWSQKIYTYLGKYVSKSPRAAYFNYRDLDLGMNNKGNTSYEQAKIWGEKYFKNNFDRLVKVKTKIDPTNFFRNEQRLNKTLRGSSAGKGLGQSPSGRRFEPQQGHWRHYKPAASPGPRGTNRGGPALKQRDPVGTASRVRKATPGNHEEGVDSLFPMAELRFSIPQEDPEEEIVINFVHNQRITSDVKPSIIFTPTKESQIKAAIRCSKIHGLQIRIRSGGHDHEGLSYTSETPFFIIDLRNLRSISIDTQKKTGWVQAGATIGELYYRIAQQSKKLAFPAGVCPNVGVGGHFSGGGYGMLARKFGTVADNIIDAKLIDANGQILDRESMGEDHFWAIRGGGGTSFGIITSWKVKLHDIPEKVTVFNVTRTLEQNATQLVYKWQHITDKVDDNLLLRSNISSPFKRGQRSIHAIFFTMFVGGVDELLHEMKKSFPELGLMKEDCIEMSWIESIIFFYIGFPKGTSPDVLLNWNTTTKKQFYFKGKLDYVQHPISIKGLEGIWKLYNKLGENAGVELQFSP